ncbi:RimJ/RimL family protein N-acetyltransferase [Actinoallomurus bryophytorum]|uniref:RimJ/RimL family protein N-acetyltransferase n=1 Tax=Actinoallomurus bryophytorum TaxID=1490222 RepID=A0A543CQU6_9ACTN|nr:GNAT family protein [Actinoallomurus bryophytorum]TQL99469.1 RimJ/RimL family protein N-acetyltransferase [Actinoallomurus bryophytorum]
MARFEPTTLSTDRLTLRPPAAGDAGDALAAVDDEVRKWMPWAPGYTHDKALTWCVEEAYRDPARETHFVIVPRANGRFAGVIGIGRADWESRVAETGYWLGPDGRGNGYVTEAVREVARHVFGLGFHRLELLAATGNVASQQVAERAGFTREGVLREARLVPGGRSDMVLFSLLKGEL